jgi:hypothetical protein
MRRRTPILEALAISGAVALAACSAARSSAEAEAVAEAEVEAARAEAPLAPDVACRAPITFLAFVEPGQCANRPGRSGRWTARAIFPNAPESARPVACRFSWDPAPGLTSTPPDVEALSTLDPDHLTEASPATTCSEASAPEGTARLRPPKDGGDVGPPTGVTGCDVCAQIHDSRVFVILPANAPELRTLLISTSDGRVSTFDLAAPKSAQAFSVALPPLPAGVTYRADDIHLIASPF